MAVRTFLIPLNYLKSPTLLVQDEEEAGKNSLAHPVMGTIITSHNQLIVEAIEPPQGRSHSFRGYFWEPKRFDKIPTQCCPHSSSQAVNRNKDYCFRCHQFGHFAAEFPEQADRKDFVFWSFSLLLI